MRVEPCFSKLGRVLAACVVAVLCLATTPPARADAEAADAYSTGVVLNASQVQALFPNNTYVERDRYAVLRSDSLRDLQELFVKAVFRNGLRPAWSPRFACGKFSMVFVATARLAYLAAHPEARAVPELAVGEVWFMTGPNSAHAIVVAVTERGVVYWDPQCGHEVPMPGDRLASTFLRKF